MLKHWCKELGEFEITFIKAQNIINLYNTYCPYFWEHHGFSHNDYLYLAKQSELLYGDWKTGKSTEDMLNCPYTKDVAKAYFTWPDIITVSLRSDGLYDYTGDGRHRIRAAQELDIHIPVIVDKRNSHLHN